MAIIDQLIALLAAGLSALFIALSAFIPALAPQPVARPASTTAVTQAAPAATSTATASTTPNFPAKSLGGGSQREHVGDKDFLQEGSAQASTPAPIPAAPTPTPTPTTPPKSQEQVNTDARAALVNILCTTKFGGYVAPISGSGVIIDSRGVILTNAHVGQYFLLRDYYVKDNIDCVVRIGSPAEARYTAELLYLPPAWIAGNASQITASQAHGTGEHDYAFLRITGTTDPSGTLPSSFAALPMASAYPAVGDSMLLAAYPAGYLGGETITKALYASSALAYVTQLFSYDDDTKKVDLFSIGGTVVSQAGSSGGAVVRLRGGTLAGLIATATVANSTNQRDLRAITLSHIDASLAAQGQGGISTLLIGNLAAKAADFAARIAPAERAALYKALQSN